MTSRRPIRDDAACSHFAISNCEALHQHYFRFLAIDEREEFITALCASICLSDSSLSINVPIQANWKILFATQLIFTHSFMVVTSKCLQTKG